MDFGTLFGGLLGLFGGGLNVWSNQKMNQLNIDLMREMNRENRELTMLGWERDDNAIRRRVEDLRAAGLNPVLAAGQPAGNMQPIKVGTTETRSVEAGQMIQQALAGMQMQKDISMTNAQIAHLRQQDLHLKTQDRFIESQTRVQEQIANRENLEIKLREADLAERYARLSQTSQRTAIEAYDWDLYRRLELPTGTNLRTLSLMEQIIEGLGRLTNRGNNFFLELPNIENAVKDAFKDLFTPGEYQRQAEQWVEEIESGRIPNGFERLYLRNVRNLAPANR